MPKKRLLVVSVLLVALLGIGLGLAALVPEGPGVTKANFDRIKEGMNLAEVEAIFGATPKYGNQVPGGYAWFAWSWRRSGNATATITMHPSEGVIEKIWTGCDELFLDKIRRWLHLR